MFDATFLERFWAKVHIPTVDGVPDANACWPWQGAKTHGKHNSANVYGRVKYKGRSIYTHRVACAIATGELKDDHDAAHADTCTTGLCCNGRHLKWELPRENRNVARFRKFNGSYSKPKEQAA